MPEIELRSGLVGREAWKVRRWLESEARRIALAYQSAIEAADFLRRPNPNGQFQAGSRTMKRIPIPPFRRPDNILKSEIYRLADKISRDPAHVIEIEMRVRKRDKKLGIIHRPRKATAIDWSIRLVTGYRFIREGGENRPLRVNQISDTIVSRWGVELNYAFECGIKLEFCTMFLDHIGGYEYITSGLLNESGNPSRMPWWSQITEVKSRSESRQETYLREAGEHLADLAECE